MQDTFLRKNDKIWALLEVGGEGKGRVKDYEGVSVLDDHKNENVMAGNRKVRKKSDSRRKMSSFHF